METNPCSDACTHQMLLKSLGKNPKVCVCVCVCACKCPTTGFFPPSFHLQTVMNTVFLTLQSASSFKNPRGAAGWGSEGRAGSLAFARLQRGYISKMLGHFFLFFFFNIPSARRTNTLALADTRVHCSGLQGSRGQGGVMKSNRLSDAVCCWSLEITEGFHYGALWWRECKREGY